MRKNVSMLIGFLRHAYLLVTIMEILVAVSTVNNF
jgi:hypothetical protein